VQDFDVHLDAYITLNSDVTVTVRALQRIRDVLRLRRSSPRHSLLTMITALAIRRVDYCISLLAACLTPNFDVFSES